MAYDELSFDYNGNIQSELISQFPTGSYDPQDAGQYNNTSISFATPFSIPTTGDDFYAFATGSGDQNIFGSLTGLTNITDFYGLIAAYHPSGGQIGSFTFSGTNSEGSSITQTFILTEGSDVRDFYDGQYEDTINGTTTQNAFQINDVVGGGDTGNTSDGYVGTYNIDEMDFHFSQTFATLTGITYDSLSADNLLLLGATAETACFCAGTMILTPAGEAPVETLQIGDLVTTLGGEARPVRWIGHRNLEFAKHPDPKAVWPIRMSASAFGRNLPARDLWVSPGHNVFAEGVLMPASALVNGATVTQEMVDKVTYWHVELDSHDVIWADGLPTESYLDTGNRTGFENGGAFIEAHPDFRPKHWAETCVPLVTSGPEVENTKGRLLSRAKSMGHTTTADHDVHIVADGRRIDPINLDNRRWAFALPAECRGISMVSRTFIPCHTNPKSGDGRSLGLCVNRLQVDGTDVDLKGDLSSQQWSHLESYSGHIQRWTTGRITLPAGSRIVMLDLASDGQYWLERRDNVIALRA